MRNGSGRNLGWRWNGTAQHTRNGKQRVALSPKWWQRQKHHGVLAGAGRSAKIGKNTRNNGKKMAGAVQQQPGSHKQLGEAPSEGLRALGFPLGHPVDGEGPFPVRSGVDKV